jgi:predicted secreted protein
MRFETVATMSLATSIAIYFIIWWVVLFAVLPWGVRSQDEQGTITPGSDPGAPAIPNLKRKLIWTTIVAAVVFAMWHIVYTYRLIALDDLAALLGLPR